MFKPISNAVFKKANVLTRQMSSAATEEVLKRTALYDFHVRNGGKMVGFAGYELPVQYKDGVVTSHMHVRQDAGVFDVSHMGQLRFHGKDREAFLESVVVADIANLKPHQASLSVITNEKGGIIDDCVVTKRDNFIAMVVNAGCKDKDLAHFKKHIAESKKDVRIEYLEDRSLLALQGPKAAAVLARFLPANIAAALPQWPFMSDKDVQVGKYNCTVTRCGYTGEDGFEISVASQDAIALMELLCGEKEVQPAALAVRDSLRLEAGLCLYGHDLDETITPVEAALAWTISKRRREQGGFLGYQTIKQQLESGVSRKRVGLLVTGAPARENADIVDSTGRKVGKVTSGTFSPVLKRAVSMAYVETAVSKLGTKLGVQVRGKTAEAEVTKMPFVPSRYHRVADK